MSLFNKIKQFFSLKRTGYNLKEPNLNEIASSDAPWWGHYTIEEEQSRFFKIGNIVLCLDRYSSEWHITSYKNFHGVQLPMDNNELPSQTTHKLLSELPQNVKPYKKLSAYTSNEISLKPTLPDRTLLTSLAHQYYIPSHQSLLIFVRLPVWIRIKAGKPSIYLDEIPTQVLSDSWSGMDTLTGELCYETITDSSPRLEELPVDRMHAICPVRIENRARDTLLIKELKIPLPFLSIYSDLDNQLWTEEIMSAHESLQFPHISIGKAPIKITKELKLISPSRLNSKSTFRDLFSSFTGK